MLHINVICGLVFAVQVIDTLDRIRFFTMRQIVDDDPFQPLSRCVLHQIVQCGRQFDDGGALGVLGHDALYWFLPIFVDQIQPCASHEEQDDAFVVVLAERDVHGRFADGVGGVDITAMVQ